MAEPVVVFSGWLFKGERKSTCVTTRDVTYRHKRDWCYLLPTFRNLCVSLWTALGTHDLAFVSCSHFSYFKHALTPFFTNYYFFFQFVEFILKRKPIFEDCFHLSSPFKVLRLPWWRSSMTSFSQAHTVSVKPHAPVFLDSPGLWMVVVHLKLVSWKWKVYLLCVLWSICEEVAHAFGDAVMWCPYATL